MGEAAGAGPDIWDPTFPAWETLVGFQAPDFGLARALQAFGQSAKGWNLCVSPPRFYFLNKLF